MTDPAQQADALRSIRVTSDATALSVLGGETPGIQRTLDTPTAVGVAAVGERLGLAGLTTPGGVAGASLAILGGSDPDSGLSVQDFVSLVFRQRHPPGMAADDGSPPIGGSDSRQARGRSTPPDRDQRDAVGAGFFPGTVGDQPSDQSSVHRDQSVVPGETGRRRPDLTPLARPRPDRTAPDRTSSLSARSPVDRTTKEVPDEGSPADVSTQPDASTPDSDEPGERTQSDLLDEPERGGTDASRQAPEPTGEKQTEAESEPDVHSHPGNRERQEPGATETGSVRSPPRRSEHPGGEPGQTQQQADVATAVTGEDTLDDGPGRQAVPRGPTGKRPEAGRRRDSQEPTAHARPELAAQRQGLSVAGHRSLPRMRSAAAESVRARETSGSGPASGADSPARPAITYRRRGQTSPPRPGDEQGSPGPRSSSQHEQPEPAAGDGSEQSETAVSRPTPAPGTPQRDSPTPRPGAPRPRQRAQSTVSVPPQAETDEDRSTPHLSPAQVDPGRTAISTPIRPGHDQSTAGTDGAHTQSASTRLTPVRGSGQSPAPETGVVQPQRRAGDSRVPATGPRRQVDEGRAASERPSSNRAVDRQTRPADGSVDPSVVDRQESSAAETRHSQSRVRETVPGTEPRRVSRSAVDPRVTAATSDGETTSTQRSQGRTRESSTRQEPRRVSRSAVDPRVTAATSGGETTPDSNSVSSDPGRRGPVSSPRRGGDTSGVSHSDSTASSLTGPRPASAAGSRGRPTGRGPGGPAGGQGRRGQAAPLDRPTVRDPVEFTHLSRRGQLGVTSGEQLVSGAGRRDTVRRPADASGTTARDLPDLSSRRPGADRTPTDRSDGQSAGRGPTSPTATRTREPADQTERRQPDTTDSPATRQPESPDRATPGRERASRTGRQPTDRDRQSPAQRPRRQSGGATPTVLTPFEPGTTAATGGPRVVQPAQSPSQQPPDLTSGTDVRLVALQQGETRPDQQVRPPAPDSSGGGPTQSTARTDVGRLPFRTVESPDVAVTETRSSDTVSAGLRATPTGSGQTTGGFPSMTVATRLGPRVGGGDGASVSTGGTTLPSTQRQSPPETTDGAPTTALTPLTISHDQMVAEATDESGVDEQAEGDRPDSEPSIGPQLRPRQTPAVSGAQQGEQEQIARSGRSLPGDSIGGGENLIQPRSSGRTVRSSGEMPSLTLQRNDTEREPGGRESSDQTGQSSSEPAGTGPTDSSSRGTATQARTQESRQRSRKEDLAERVERAPTQSAGSGGGPTTSRDQGRRKDTETPPEGRATSQLYPELTVKTLAPRIDATRREEVRRDVTHRSTERGGDRSQQRGGPPDPDEFRSGGDLGERPYPADIDRMAERLYREIERKRRIERERRGL